MRGPLPSSVAALALVLVLGLGLGACATTPAADGDRIVEIQRGRPTLVEARATVRVDADGTIVVTLPRCELTHVVVEHGATERLVVPCEDTFAELAVTAPWGATRRATVEVPDRSAPYARLAPAWDDAPLDPLDPASWERGARPWRLAHPLLRGTVEWTPLPDEVRRIAAGIALAASGDPDLSTAVTRVPPDLVAGPLRVDRDELLAGGASLLGLTVENRGAGTAYRVIATTRSSVPSLHGVQLRFGRIEPGQSLTRYAQVRVPAVVDEESAMIVVVFEEANGFSPGNVSRRLPIRVVKEMPRLAVTCTPTGGAREVDAGQLLRLRCTVENGGGRLARAVEVRAGLGTSQVAAPPIDVGAQATAQVELPVRVPVGATLDQELVIAVVAADAAATARATTEVRVVVRRPGLCPNGKIDRDTYKARRRALEEARSAGDLTAEEFDRYDAELVGCLGA